MITEIEINNDDFLIDFVIKNSPDIGRFKFDNVFDGLKTSLVDRITLLQKRNRIKSIMLDQLKYIEIDKNFNLNVILSDKGREVKKAGGHLAYLDNIVAKEREDKLRQIISDEKNKLDLIITKFNSGLGIKITIGTFIVLIVPLIISLFSTYVTGNKTPAVDTAFLKKQLQTLDLRIQKLEQNTMKDTIPK